MSEEMSEDHWESAQEGAELLAEGEFDHALQVLGAVLEAEPDNEYAHFFVGNVHFEREEHVQALRAFLTALELAPRFLGAMINTGQTLRMLGRYGEAIRMGKQALSVSEQDADALYLIGVCHFARGDNENATSFLRRFLDTRPEPELVSEVEGMLQVIAGQIVPIEPES